MQPLQLALVIPTFNERANILPLLSRLRSLLDGIEWEAIFVDDNSADGTAAFIREIARLDPRVRVLQRVGRRGLASACIEGILATPAPYVAVMDADLQHDESVLPRMFELITTSDLDLVVGSRNIEGGGMGNFAKERVMLSGLGSRLSRTVCKCNLSDPMSGFFMLKREFFEDVVPRLSGMGFKILVDIVASAQRRVRFAEVPYTFRNRERGESKLDLLVGLEYLQLLIDKLIGQWVPTRFLLFAGVGALGVLVHMSVLTVSLQVAGLSFIWGQATATTVAMVFNFLLNNLTTFRDRRLRGFRLVTGLLSYCLACSVGAATNLSLSAFLLAAGLPWYLAGMLGLGVGSVWNYGVNELFTWRRDFKAAQRPTPGTTVEYAGSTGQLASSGNSRA